MKASDPVHERLRGDILDGRLAPGDPIPSERVLAEEFGVGRHAVREAVKRLEQLGLVRISHGGATRVLDWRDSAGLDVLLDLFATGHTPPDLLRAALEMRATIGVDAARLCAQRARRDDQRAEVARLASEPDRRRRLRRAVARDRHRGGEPRLPPGLQLARRRRSPSGPSSPTRCCRRTEPISSALGAAIAAGRRAAPRPPSPMRLLAPPA